MEFSRDLSHDTVSPKKIGDSTLTGRIHVSLSRHPRAVGGGGRFPVRELKKMDEPN